jgi:DNA replication protein DnaC
MQLRAADKDDISYSDFVTRLMRAQWQARQEGALEWRIRRASLPERWSLETFPFARQPGVNRKQIRGFAELEFIAKAENIVLVGETGRGKTGLACGLLLKALENGYRCQFIKAQNLFDEMYASLADRSTRQLLKRLAQLDVLIDEFGYLNLKPEQSNIFFKLMEWKSATASIPPSSPRISSMTNGRTFWAAGRWWKRCSAVCGITVTPCPLTVRRCASRRVEEHDHGRRRRPGRIHSPGSGGVSQNAGQMGTVRRPDRVLAAQLYQRGVSVSVIENALVLAATRRLIRPTNAPPLGTVRSLAYFLPVIEEVLDLKVGPA